MSYDQWKTASPYDDEIDIIDECRKVASKCQKHIDTHADISDLTQTERMLLEQCRDTLNEAARYIDEEV